MYNLALVAFLAFLLSFGVSGLIMAAIVKKTLKFKRISDQHGPLVLITVASVVVSVIIHKAVVVLLCKILNIDITI